MTETAGVDIGGTKIAVGLVDGQGGVRRYTRAATPRDGAVAIIDRIAELLREIQGPQPIGAIGVGAPGVIDPATGVVRSATEILPGWAGTDVRGELWRRLAVPIAVTNDVAAMAYGEARCGAGQGISRVLHVSVGTGLGAALTQDGVLRDDPVVDGIAHVVIPERGAVPCGCGGFEHLESVVTGPSIAAAYSARSGSEPLPLPQVVERRHGGDTGARDVIAGAAAVLGRTLRELALDVDAIVLGGGVSGIGPEFVEPVRAELAPSGIPLYTAKLGVSAPIVGAGLLAGELMQATEGAH